MLTEVKFFLKDGVAFFANECVAGYMLIKKRAAKSQPTLNVD